ncbi:MAG TPA: hypothetical protein VHN80_05380 [Kineosporiaceae bacterium]|nr:hypothetical protein [Kineosporiaceae bacterium]
MKRHHAGVLVLLLATVSGTAAACGSKGGSSPAGSSPAGSSPAGSTAAASNGGGSGSTGRTTGGTAYQFALPQELPFTADAPQRTKGGAVERRWRHAVHPAGPFCTVVGVEQPHFTQRFPESVLAVFEATNQGGDHVVRNAAVPPVAGAIGGVEQESTFTATLDDGSSTPARLFQRQYLTPGRTLVSISAAGPQDQVETCRLAAIVGSLEVTGTELGSAPGGA